MANQHMFRDGLAWLKALPLLAVTGALAVMALATLAGAQSGDARAREALFDYFQRMAPARYDPNEAFHAILIDREATDLVGPWPWPRTLLGDVVEAAEAAGAKAVVIVEPLDAPDPLSPETIGAFWLEGASDEALARELARLPSTNAALAHAFEAAPGAIGVSAQPPADPTAPRSMRRADIATTTDWLRVAREDTPFLALPAARFLYDIDADLAAATTLAVAAAPPDADGVVRRLPTLWALDGAPAPSLALAAARFAADGAPVTVAVDPSAVQSEGRIVRRLELEDASVDLAHNSAMRLYLPRRASIATTSAARLINPNANSQLAGKVALIGRDADLGGALSTARGDFSTAELHALAAAQILNGAAPARPGWAGYAEALAVMLFGAAAIMIAQRFQFWQAVGFAAAASAVLILAAFAAFANNAVLIDPLAPSLALFVGALSVAGGRSLGGALRDDSVRGSFHDALPEPVMKRLRDGAGDGLLDGAYREITVLACELRIAEDDLRTLETLPDDVTRILAAASIDLRQTIIDAGGAADQAEGGRVFAYFNAPADLADHVQAGCAAALRLVESMDRINASLEGSSRTRGVQVRLAIGIATGPCFVGPMGHGRNNRYSAVGQAVDSAAYLRGLSTYYGPAMICDEPVYRETHHKFAFLELDRVKTRTASRPFNIYALIGNPFIKSSKGFRELDDSHRALLAAYRSGDIAEAQTQLARVKTSPGAKIALFEIYEERLNRLAKEGLPEGWDGVTSEV